ncbi:hypothetical protein HYU40_03285 [Candidatus Woesearchaeota archaeon]|nr:hypothetical protein [Candidatus Woesearchaeota archaeon]
MTASSQKNSSHHHEKAMIKALVIVAIVVLAGFLMATYVGRFFKGNDGKKLDVKYYNGFAFAKVGNSWYTQWERDGQTYELEFRHSPWEVENITVVGRVDERFQMPYMFITFDPAEGNSRQTSFVALAAADLSSVLRGVFEKEGIAAGCTRNETAACANRPVVTCSTNASVIYLKVADEAGIFLDGNCATIQGIEENLTMAADKAMYQWLGIVKK